VPCRQSSQSSIQNGTERSNKTPPRQKGLAHANPLPTRTEDKLPPPPSQSHSVPHSQAAQSVQSTRGGDIFSAMESYRLDIGTPAWMEKAQSIGPRF
jgi:hypothetical protein